MPCTRKRGQDLTRFRVKACGADGLTSDMSCVSFNHTNDVPADQPKVPITRTQYIYISSPAWLNFQEMLRGTKAGLVSFSVESCRDASGSLLNIRRNLRQL